MRRITRQEKNLIKEKLLYGPGKKKTWRNIIKEEKKGKDAKD